MVRQAGFTLLELLVVLAIISLLILAVPQLRSGGRQGFQAQAAAYELATALRGTRALAISSNSETQLVLDVSRKIYRAAPKGRDRTLQATLALQADGAVVPGDSRLAVIRFFPDGSSSGGRITIAPASGPSHFVRVQILSGRVLVDD
jgi:general secretion pathway protein H